MRPILTSPILSFNRFLHSLPSIKSIFAGDRRDWQLEPYRPLPAYQQLPQQDQSAYLNYHHQYLIPFHNQADFQLNLNQGVNPYQTVQGQTTQTSQGCLPHARERASNRNPYYREERKERKSHNQGSPTATTSEFCSFICSFLLALLLFINSSIYKLNPRAN